MDFLYFFFLTFPKEALIFRECSPPTTCHMSYVTCHMSCVACIFFFLDIVVKLIGGGSVINGAYLVQFFPCSKHICLALGSPKINFVSSLKSILHIYFTLFDPLALSSYLLKSVGLQFALFYPAFDKICFMAYLTI